MTLQPGYHGAHMRQISLCSIERRQSDDFHVECAAHLIDVANSGAPEFLRETVVVDVRNGPHVSSGTLLHLNHATVRKHTDRFSGGGAADAKHFHQLWFGGQSITDAILTRSYHLSQLRQHLINQLALEHRTETGGTRKVGRSHYPSFDVIDCSTHI
jgi:hypothetical protein